MALAVEEALRGKMILWGAPTFDQVRIAWTEMQHGCGGVVDFVASRMEALFPTDGRVVFRSLDDPDNARGHTADGVIIDEVADVQPRAWYEVLRPMLTDRGGWLFAMGTPRGRNWVWAEHTNAAGRPDSIAWQAPLLGAQIVDGHLVRAPHPLENPAIPWTEIERLWSTLPERTFRQEILAEFVETGGGVFRNVREMATGGRVGYSLGNEYAIGVDWGKLADFTVLAVIDCTNQRMVELDRFNQIDYQVQVGRLLALCERYHPRTVVVERNSVGEPLIEQLQRQGLPVVPFLTTAASKQTLIDALALALERRELILLNDPVLIAELEAFEMERMPSGMLRYGAPQGMHDDCVIATALAWMAMAMEPARVYTMDY